MDPINLYASKTNRNAALSKAKMWMFFSVLAFLFTPFGLLLAAPIFAIGFWFGGPEFGSQGASRPSFEADANGFTAGQQFSVTNRHRVSWEDFRGVEIRTVGFEPFLAERVLVVKTANNGEKKIRKMMMSGTPDEMAQQINTYARDALRAKGLTVLIAEIEQSSYRAAEATVPSLARQAVPKPTSALSPVDVGPRITSPILAKAPVRKATFGDSGPIQSKPRLSERIFGRSKVM